VKAQAEKGQKELARLKNVICEHEAKGKGYEFSICHYEGIIAKREQAFEQLEQRYRCKRPGLRGVVPVRWMEIVTMMVNMIIRVGW
jgi:hypothetical protein